MATQQELEEVEAPLRHHWPAVEAVSALLMANCPNPIGNDAIVEVVLAATSL
jgi:hypothetical protein